MLDVPVIDFATLDESTLAERVHAASADWGFFQMLGHGIPAAVREDMVAAGNAFFRQSLATKQQISRSAANPWGYFDAELTKNIQDWKEILDIGPANGPEQPQWPVGLAGFREAVERYHDAVEGVARRITRVVLRNLGDREAQELDGFEPHTSFLRLNHYPVCPNPAPATISHSLAADDAAGRLGISHHTDAGAVTVLLQHGPPGLQVLHGGRWHLVPVRDDALVINIGDIAQVWSNDGYTAPLHRVLANAQQERFSAAYFFNPGYAYNYQPLAEAPGDSQPRYRRINWGEFRSLRSAGDYVSQGEEIQIDHFRLDAAAAAY